MKKVVSLVKDIALIVAIVFVISLWQERNLLDSDGTVQIEQMRFATLSGEVANIAAEDKRTLVYFFAPWCSVCEMSIGNLENVNNESLDVVRVALDYRSTEEVTQFTQRAGIEADVLLGSHQLKEQFNITGYPTYYILNENREIVASSYGYSTSWGMKLKNLLNSSS